MTLAPGSKRAAAKTAFTSLFLGLGAVAPLVGAQFLRESVGPTPSRLAPTEALRTV